jgi:hypothetical protein
MPAGFSKPHLGHLTFSDKDTTPPTYVFYGKKGGDIRVYGG